MITKILASFSLLVLTLSCSNAQSQTVRQVYLVQNSGWMEPYYLDPASQFVALAESLISATQLEGVDITLASFNQNGQIPNRTSPDVVYAGAYSEELVRNGVAKIDLPRRPNGRYADADFLGALSVTISDLLKGDEGIIWMLSNNKNSPNNDQNIAANTRGFYELLRGSDFITRIVAFPLRMSVSGPNFSEKGFIVYGIAYGESAAQALDVITARDTPLRALFADPPVFLKPLEPQTLDLELNPQAFADGAAISMQNGVVVIDGLEGGRQTNAAFVARVRNVAYPKKIVSAEVRTSWNGYDATQNVTAGAVPAIRDLATGATSDPLSLTLAIPPVTKEPGVAGLLQTEAMVDGYLDITLEKLSFDLDDRFVQKASAVFGGDMMGEGQRTFLEQQLPSIFFDFRSVDTSITRVPVRLIIRFPAWPLYVGGFAIALLIAALVALPILLFKARMHVVQAGGTSHKLFLKPGQQLEVSGPDGSRHLVRGRIFGAPSVASIS
ncbi:hypothetical protein [Rhizobium sp. X9]|uniref:hypothetical protein n=1 Tax=Rhizobium sp. X9 TaxID=2815360 RepID=UPI001C0E21A4|nr:hypothetical protein [Rhizobium sp. X9]